MDINEIENTTMIIGDDIEIENENDKPITKDTDIDFPQYYNVSRKRKKKSKNKKNELNIYEIRNVEKDENIFEVEKIKEHQIKDKRYIFYIKWKNYDESENSWVKEKDFNQKDLILEYFNEKNIIFNF
jgi:hypothetical protein